MTVFLCKRNKFKILGLLYIIHVAMATIEIVRSTL